MLKTLQICCFGKSLRVPSEIPRNKLIESLQKLRVHFYKSNKRIDEGNIGKSHLNRIVSSLKIFYLR